MTKFTFDLDGLSSNEIEQVRSIEEQGLYKTRALIYEIKALSSTILDSSNEEEIIGLMRFRQMKNVLDKIEGNLSLLNDYLNNNEVEKLFPEEILHFDSTFQINALKIFINLLHGLLSQTSNISKYNILSNPDNNLIEDKKLITNIFLNLIQIIRKHYNNNKTIEVNIRENSLYISYRLANMFYDLLKLNKDAIIVTKLLDEMGLSQLDDKQINVGNNNNDNDNNEQKMQEWLKEEEKDEEERNRELFKRRVFTVVSEICKNFYNRKLGTYNSKNNILNSIIKNIEGLDNKFKKELYRLLNNTYNSLHNFLHIYISKTPYFKGSFKDQLAYRIRVYYLDYTYIRDVELKKGILKAYTKNKLIEFMSNLNPKSREFIEQFGLLDLLVETIFKTLFDTLNREELDSETKNPIPDEVKEKYKDYIIERRKSYE
ncbi:MAG: hypothetical protein PHH06_01485 [Candidatus Gracilibacteria bacterium]|nr:hypothetical protein [Candidatus Gracilibacteria bacterium]